MEKCRIKIFLFKSRFSVFKEIDFERVQLRIDLMGVEIECSSKMKNITKLLT